MSEILASPKETSFPSEGISNVPHTHNIYQKRVDSVSPNGTIPNHHDAIPVGSNPPLGDLSLGDGYKLSGIEDVYSTLYWRNLKERLSA